MRRKNPRQKKWGKNIAREQCYEAKKNRVKYAFQISKLELNGDRQVNLKMKRMLSSYSNPNIAIKDNKILELKILSDSKKTIETKNATGDATKFKNEIMLNVLVSIDGTAKKKFSVTENFIYNNNSNTSELRTYENQIKIQSHKKINVNNSNEAVESTTTHTDSSNSRKLVGR